MKIETPLGTMDCLSCEDEFLQGTFNYKNEELLLSIKVSEFDGLLNIDFNYITTILNNLDNYMVAAVDYLRERCGSSPAEFGFSTNFVFPSVKELTRGAEIIFWQKDRWSILFSECSIPISNPYGILVNIENGCVIEYEDLSNAEEV